jgi:hypothetical protein
LNTMLIAAGIWLLAACRTLPEYVSVLKPGSGQ